MNITELLRGMQENIQLLSDTINYFLLIKNQEINWTSRPTPGKWSGKEIIGHLIDSAQINLQRFVRCTYEENFKLTYDQVEWVAANHYQETPIDDLFNLWALLNRQIIRVWENYPSDRLSARCDNSKEEPNLQTVEWLAADYIQHMLHHLNQIK